MFAGLYEILIGYARANREPRIARPLVIFQSLLEDCWLYHCIKLMIFN